LDPRPRNPWRARLRGRRRPDRLRDDDAKVNRDPDSETLSTYALASLGGALAAGAVEQPDLSMLLYPAYYCVMNAATAILIHRQRVALNLAQMADRQEPPRRRVAGARRGLRTAALPAYRGPRGQPNRIPGEIRIDTEDEQQTLPCAPRRNPGPGQQTARGLADA